MSFTVQQIAAANAGEALWFRCAVHVSWPGVAELIVRRQITRMAVSPFPADEFVAFIRERFPSARIDRTSNHLGTVWIKVRTDARHAEIVATADGVIGATDIARLNTEEENANSFALFDKQLDSVQAARDFMIRALS